MGFEKDQGTCTGRGFTDVDALGIKESVSLRQPKTGRPIQIGSGVFAIFNNSGVFHNILRKVR